MKATCLSGESPGKIIAGMLVELLAEAGAAAVTIHGRTMEQRYRKAADWELISAVAAEASVPVIGNGDLLTHYEVADRQKVSSLHALMIGRGALIKPWIFQEVSEVPAPLEPMSNECSGMLAISLGSDQFA
jgi:tRNA-dihydrouridine synthase 3